MSNWTNLMVHCPLVLKLTAETKHWRGSINTVSTNFSKYYGQANSITFAHWILSYGHYFQTSHSWKNLHPYCTNQLHSFIDCHQVSMEIRDLPNTVTPNSYSLFSSCTGRLTYWNWSAKTAEQWRREMHTSNCWHSHHELDPNLAGFRLYKRLPFALFPCKNRSTPGAPTLKFYFNSKILTTLKRSHLPRTLLVYWWDRKLHAHDIGGNMTRH